MGDDLYMSKYKMCGLRTTKILL